VIAGHSRSESLSDLDAWVFKVDNSGELVWEMRYGGEKNDLLHSIIQSHDNGYIVSGHTRSQGKGGYDYWIFSIDKDGKKNWEKVYGSSKDDFSSEIVKTDDGYAVAGNMSQKDKLFDFWMLKLDKSGNTQWNKYYGGYDVSNSLTQTPDGGFLIAGNTKNGDGYSDMWVLKLNGEGNIMWSNILGQDEEFDYANKLITTEDGGYVVAGFSPQTKAVGKKEKKISNDFWIVNINQLGQVLWEKTFGGTEDDRINSIVNTSNGSYVAAGYTESDGAGKLDVWVVKFTGYLFDLGDCLDGKKDTLNSLSTAQKEDESLKSYLKRIKKYEKLKSDRIDDCQEAYEIESAQKIAGSYQSIYTLIRDLSYYNADQGAYKVLLDDWYRLPMPVEEAKTFKNRYKDADVKGYKRLSPNLRDYEYINLYTKHPESGARYGLGMWVKDKSLKDFKANGDSIEYEVKFTDVDAGSLVG